MRAIVKWSAVAVLLATTMTVRVGAESSVTLTVRLYNTSGIPAPQLSAARRAADSILRDTGLDVRFRLCGRRASPEGPVDPCDESLKPSEVIVRVIDAPRFNTALYSDAYGVTYIVKETNQGWLATVFSDRIDRAAQRVGIQPGTLLGRVIAHEVGHLLLGSGYHGEAGVMRAEWPDALLDREGNEWRFSMLEAARMQRAVASIARDSSGNSAAIDPLPTDSHPRSIVFDKVVASTP
jgi:hypothetical protein